MFIHTRSSAPKMFAEFARQTRTFGHKKLKKKLPNSSQTDFSSRIYEMDGMKLMRRSRIYEKNY